MSPRALILTVSAAVLAASSLTLPTAAAAPAPGPGPVIDTSPLTTVINAAKGRKQKVFSVQVSAQAGDRRFVRSDIDVSNVTVPSGLAGIFLGVSVTCTGPGGTTAMDIEGGRNVWKTDSGFDVVVMGTLASKTAGVYTCVTTVMICDPGSCTSPASSGSVTLIKSSGQPSSGSQLAVSAALPSWANVLQVPKATDVLVNPGKSLAMPKTFNLSGATGPIAMGSVVSLTNCIVKGYPPACNAAPKMAVQGSARVTISFVVTQKATTAGAKCAVVRATRQSSVITWQEHHAVVDISIPAVTLSNAAGCSQTVTATTTVTVGSGNSVAVEGGSKNVVESVTFALPGAVLDA